MARTIVLIRKSIINSLVLAASAIGIVIDPNKWISVPGDLSQTDYKLLLLDTVVDATSFNEQLWDEYKLDVQAIADRAAPETGLWWQNLLINKFQFSATDPQVIGIFPSDIDPNLLLIKYSQNNDALKIISYATCQTISFGRIQLKVAAKVGGLPADIDTTYGAGTLDTIISFVNTISDSSIRKVVTSGLADRLWMQMDVYFNGVFSAVIQSRVLLAINNYLKAIPFNGMFIKSDLEAAIKAVEGVVDIVWVNIRARANSTAFPSGFDLVISNTEVNRLFNTIAGYIVTEDSAGNTLTDPRPLDLTKNNLNLIAV